MARMRVQEGICAFVSEVAIRVSHRGSSSASRYQRRYEEELQFRPHTTLTREYSL